MVVELALTFPKPDRSDYSPNFKKKEENDTVDIGWAEGVMADGRPYRAECWAQDQMTCLSIMFASEGFEGATTNDILDFLEIQKIVGFRGEKRPIAVRPFKDARGNDLLLVNLVVGDEEELYIDDKLSLQAWQETRPDGPL